MLALEAGEVGPLAGVLAARGLLLRLRRLHRNVLFAILVAAHVVLLELDAGDLLLRLHPVGREVLGASLVSEVVNLGNLLAHPIGLVDVGRHVPVAVVLVVGDLGLGRRRAGALHDLKALCLLLGVLRDGYLLLLDHYALLFGLGLLAGSGAVLLLFNGLALLLLALVALEVTLDEGVRKLVSGNRERQ